MVYVVTAVDNQTNGVMFTGWIGVPITAAYTQTATIAQLQLITLTQFSQTQRRSAAETPAKPYGIRDDTAEKIKKLRADRQQSIKRGRVTLKWTHGCQLVGVTPSIVKKYAPDLHANWYDPTF
jgi:hypothetical protein